MRSMRQRGLLNIRFSPLRFAKTGPVKNPKEEEESRKKWAARVYSCTVVVSDGVASIAVYR